MGAAKNQRFNEKKHKCVRNAFEFLCEICLEREQNNSNKNKRHDRTTDSVWRASTLYTLLTTVIPRSVCDFLEGAHAPRALALASGGGKRNFKIYQEAGRETLRAETSMPVLVITHLGTPLLDMGAAGCLC